RRIHHRRARARVAGEHDGPPGARRTDQAFRSDRPTVRQSDRLALTELAPQRTLGNARGARFLHVEPPAPLVLAQRVPHRSAPMLGLENENVVLFPLPLSPAFYRVSRLHLTDLHLKRDSLHPELDRLGEHLLRAMR